MTTPETVEALARAMQAVENDYVDPNNGMDDSDWYQRDEARRNFAKLYLAARQAETKAATDEAPAGRMTDPEIIAAAAMVFGQQQRMGATDQYAAYRAACEAMRLVRANTPPKLTAEQVEAIVETACKKHWNDQPRMVIEALRLAGVAE